MKIPKGMTEEEVFNIVEECLKRLAAKYRFAYHEYSDIKQEGWVLALKLLESGKYDGRRPLGGFVYVHLKNRLGNFKRDNYKRNEAPCEICGSGNTHKSGEKCKKYLLWEARQISRQNIVYPTDISYINDEDEPNTRYEDPILDNIALEEILEKIDSKLPLNLRHSMLQMREGHKISRNKRLEIETFVMDLLVKEDLL